MAAPLITRCHFDGRDCHCRRPLGLLQEQVLRCGHCSDALFVLEPDVVIADLRISCDNGVAVWVSTVLGSTVHRCDFDQVDQALSQLLDLSAHGSAQD